MSEINYFDKSTKLLQNLADCCELQTDLPLTRESIKSLVVIVQSQNVLLEQLAKDNYGVVTEQSDCPVVVGMLCRVPNMQVFGKVEVFGKVMEVNEDDNTCVLKLLNTSKEKRVVPINELEI